MFSWFQWKLYGPCCGISSHFAAFSTSGVVFHTILNQSWINPLATLRRKPPSRVDTVAAATAPKRKSHRSQGGRAQTRRNPGLLVQLIGLEHLPGGRHLATPEVFAQLLQDARLLPEPPRSDERQRTPPSKHRRQGKP